MKKFELVSVGAWAPFDYICRMERYPGEGETLQLDMELSRVGQVYFGDCSLNIAVASAKLGVAVQAATIVGEDFVELGYQAHLRECGVGQIGVEIQKGRRSGCNHIYFSRDGKGFCLSHLGSALGQGKCRVPDKLTENAQYFVVSEQFSDYTLHAIEQAKRFNAVTCVNGMLDTAQSHLIRFLEAADILFINESEYQRLLGQVEGEDSLFGHFDVKLVFCTMGSRGAKVIRPKGRMYVPIAKGSAPVDTTGAGDAFAAGTITGLLRGLAPEASAKMGAVVSSFVIEDWGCQTKLPAMDAVRARYKQNYGEELLI